MKHLLFIFLLPLLISASCKKTVTPPPPPVAEQLPPATQEGKNTCGFLVNGKVWLPKGRVGNGSPNLKWWYDPTYRNGTFNINGYRYDKNEGDKFTSFVIAIDNFSSAGVYALNTSGRVTGYSDYNKNCIYYREDTIPVNNNYINITKFNLQQGIIAGLFQFTLAKAGCDTIRITEGRFDIKL
jgi:hypothetical protein